MLGHNSLNQFNLIDQIYMEHFEALKEIFICGTVDGNNPPDFKKDSFYKFCDKAGIPDNRLNRGIIDTYFKAVNFEIDD